MWDKILNDRLPREVAPKIGHTEQNLHPFYAHLEEMTDTLRAQIGARDRIVSNIANLPTLLGRKDDRA